jgi:prevent-host-death family protein
MITVGIKELKNQLSKYLQYVKEGEKVIITEHNKIIAEISVPEKKEELNFLSKKLQQLKNDGKMILSKRNESYAKMPEYNDKIEWKSIYNETRKERK